MADQTKINGGDGESRARPPAGRQAKVIWDESAARNASATVAQVKATREEFMLFFGAAQSEQNGPEEIRASLDRRVVLSPITAKRLAVQLAAVIREYEPGIGLRAGNVAAYERLQPTPPLRPPAFRSIKGAHKVDLLFRFLEEYKIKPAFERSCEFLAKTLLTNRFLLGFEKNMIRSNPHEKILGLCAKMEMPGDFLAAFLESLPKADIVGFGFGEHEETCMVKAYLEFGYRFYRAIQAGPSKPAPYLSHLGFKWDAADNAGKALARYTCFPGSTAEEMKTRLSNDFYGNRAESPFEIVKGILDVASSRAAGRRFLFLDVKEENNPRSSFDINLYGANLQMQELHPFLQNLCRHYSISEKQFHNFYDQAKTHILGHLAGGLDREGRDFLTLYYGE